MASRCLWGSRTAKCFKMYVFHRGFSSVMNDLKYVHTHERVKLDGNTSVKATSKTHVSGKFDESQVNEEMKKLLGGVNLSPKKNKTVIRTFKHQGNDDEIWNVGSNIYLIDEDEEEEHGNTSDDDERCINEECMGKFYGKRRLVGCIRYKIDTEKVTIFGVKTSQLEEK